MAALLRPIGEPYDYGKPRDQVRGLTPFLQSVEPLLGRGKDGDKAGGFEGGSFKVGRAHVRVAGNEQAPAPMSEVFYPVDVEITVLAAMLRRFESNFTRQTQGAQGIDDAPRNALVEADKCQAAIRSSNSTA